MPGSRSLSDAGDRQLPDREVGDEGEVLALTLDDVVGVEGGVGAGGGGDAAANQVYALGLQPGLEVAGPNVDDVQLDLAAGELRLDGWPDLGEELDGELGGGHGDDGAEAASPLGDPGEPVAERARRYLGGHLAGAWGEQVVLAAALLDDDGLAAGRPGEAQVERVELLADRRSARGRAGPRRAAGSRTPARRAGCGAGRAWRQGAGPGEASSSASRACRGCPLRGLWSRSASVAGLAGT